MHFEPKPLASAASIQQRFRSYKRKNTIHRVSERSSHRILGVASLLSTPRNIEPAQPLARFFASPIRKRGENKGEGLVQLAASWDRSSPSSSPSPRERRPFTHARLQLPTTV